MSNSDQIEYWNGQAGERWRDEAQALDSLLAPFSESVVAALPAGLRGNVLDVGCGAGALSLLVAGRYGGTQVTGVDVSQPMLALARERADTIGAKATFIEADASEFSSHLEFDALVSRYGVMFFDNPVAAFANLHKQMRPGAALSFACWRPAKENEWIMTPFQAALSFLSGPPPMPEPRTPGPFAFAESDYVNEILVSAGWKGILIEPWDGKVTMPGDTVSDTADFALTIGPLARLIAEQEIDRQALKAEVVKLLEDRTNADGEVRLTAAAWIVTAHA